MSKQEYKFGANILENLTTGMYQDSKVIFREYIQNSCDAIDNAVKIKTLKTRNEGLINIWLDYEARAISIEDNGTGISVAEFQNTLGDIADSNKKIGENKGFRGIGRLCGLAYCKELVFTSSVKGEGIISILHCNAEKMRNLLSENAKGNKYTASEVLREINQYSTEKTKDVNSHFFKVELIGINQENTALLDEDEIRDYLSFVAPVPYQNTFIFRDSIYKHAKKLCVVLDEYTIKLEGQPIFKRFKTYIKKTDDKSHDEIFDVAPHNFYDDNGNLFAWMWIGLSKFTGAIPKTNQMRGLRLRKDNIQLGGEDTLQNLFKEDRGNSYFVGEVFAISDELVPNSQRDYFNENPARAYFEKALSRFFNEELYKLYYSGSVVNSAQKKIEKYENTVAEFNEKNNKGVFVSDDHRGIEFKKVEDAKKEAEAAQKRIEKVKEKANENPNSLIGKVINKIETETSSKSIQVRITDHVNVSNKPRYRVDRLSKYNKNERKLISKIFDLIIMATDSKTADIIINKIEDGLSQ
jgi:molecular chaperone HtpG